MDQSQTDEPSRPAREPAINAPWTVTALCLTLIALYAAQLMAGSEELQARYALSAPALRAGRWETLLTCMFLHASWAHVLMNSAVAFAFGAPVARLFGASARGATSFFSFYLVCGLIAGLGMVVMDPEAEVVGASGAVSGLLAAAVRLIDGRGRVPPLLRPTTIVFTVIWAITNYLLAAFGLTPGAIGIPVAWQAHLAGYVAGLLLIGPFVRLAGRGEDGFTY
jgi:membrane associated rhomboid family serine protease